ncbi:beta-xylosidase family glycoside hydrolase [Alkalitalea saponilacus]|uniref:Beta-xylosidase n=1 Tax=Alkalitalea saponilacus TaxID=889453 RepID=A0A1T5ABA6_9BACT|nr:family 43 glycosylhydrolase [Alkalitalea saponilacus]ASB48762.1 xylan 1,4-beta-xylosidase [Alkalitalea saponilacus]SKB32185.1 Beta-xylosidase [Alkalitalea saponilacus]
MKKCLLRIALLAVLIMVGNQALAWVGMPTPRLHVDGRYLKDPHGNIVNLHGVGITPSPWFNGGHVGEWRWHDFDVEGALAYNNSVIDVLSDPSKGWYMSYIRLHMDPHWTNTPGCTPDAHELPNCFNVDRFIKYLDEVYIPLAEHAISRGLYVVIRPPGVSPHVIGVEDDYNYAEYLMTVWDIVSSHPWIQQQEEIMFELANEPVQIRLADGSVGANTQPHFDVLVEIFQPIVDRIRENGFHNVLWIPGSGYQSHYKGFAVNPILGDNIGYAVHIYPGYWGGVRNYERFRQAWDENVKPVADFAPIIITEIDWAPDGVGAWGDGITGVAGGEGFGANFKKITDESGNVSWNLLMVENLLENGDPDGGIAYGGNPEACGYPTFHWWQEYAGYEYPRPHFENRSISDNGNGTFKNPVIYGDFPNADVILVDNMYYMLSSSKIIAGGLSLLKSNDLVNWEYAVNPLQRAESAHGEGFYSDLIPNGLSRISFHEGVFYIVFNTDNNTYILSSENPEGIWSIDELDTYYDNPVLMFAEGNKYMIHGAGDIMLRELNEDFEAVGGNEVIIGFRDYDFYGTRAYIIDGQYFITSGNVSTGSQIVFRSDELTGPYEESVLLDHTLINSVAIVETQTGQWWSLLSYNHEELGQLPSLYRLEWNDGWPSVRIVSEIMGNMQKPRVGMSFFPTALSTNDNFRYYQLGAQWNWYNSVNHSNWSLFERPGYLRIHTGNVVDNIGDAENVLTQRVLGFKDNDKSYATIRMDISEMVEGDVAGLSILQNPYAFIGVMVENDQPKIIYNNNGTIDIGSEISDAYIYLRIIVNRDEKKAAFYYSLDNEDYIPFGIDFELGFDENLSFANRFAIFNYATIEEGGFVDIDWFSTEEVFNEDMFYDPNFVGYTEDQLILESLSVESSNITMMTGSSRSLNVSALYQDGRVENVARRADILNSSPDVVRIVNGQIVALKDGVANITVTFSGELAGSETIYFDVNVTTFPLTNELFNPSIWESGTFDEETGALITGQWGFGGWTYDQGLDLSDYKYLVVKLKQPTTSGASFRIFNETSYWSTPYSYVVGSATEFVVPLQHMYKVVDGQQVKLDPKALYIIGFWSHGGIPIYIDDVFVSNSDEYYVDIPNSISEMDKPVLSDDDIVDVYSISGVLIRSSIYRRDAVNGLPGGIYIIGNAQKGYLKELVNSNRY